MPLLIKLSWPAPILVVIELQTQSHYSPTSVQKKKNSPKTNRIVRARAPLGKKGHKKKPQPLSAEAREGKQNRGIASRETRRGE